MIKIIVIVIILDYFSSLNNLDHENINGIINKCPINWMWY